MGTQVVKSNSSEMVAPPASLIEASLQLPARNMEVVSQQLVAMATCSPDVARSAIYCVPVGKDPKTGLQKFKLGESIRLAEMGQGAFGRMMCDMHISEQTSNSVTVKAILLDLQTLNIYTGLGVARIYNENRAKLAVGAASSIARRNAILSMIRPYTNAILPQIKAAIVKGLSEEGSVKEALEILKSEFMDLGVPEDAIKAAVAGERDNVDRVVVLLGILNSVRDGMIEVGDVFGTPVTQGKAPRAQNATSVKDGQSVGKSPNLKPPAAKPKPVEEEPPEEPPEELTDEPPDDDLPYEDPEEREPGSDEGEGPEDANAPAVKGGLTGATRPLGAKRRTLANPE